MQVFLFRTLNISCHSLLACKVSAEKSADSLMGVPSYMTLCFSLAAFKILSLTSAIWIMICLNVDLFGFIFLGTLCSFCTFISVSFFRFGKFSAIISSNTFFDPLLSLSLFFWNPYHAYVGMFYIIP